MALVLVEEKKEKKEEPEAEKEEEETPLPVFLNEQFGALLQSKRLADVIFHVGEEKLYAHRLVLAASSPIFEVMLFEYKDGAPDNTLAAPVEVKITGCDAKTFQLLLQCIYTDEVDINADNIQSLMKVAKKYQVDKLSALCADFMQGDVNADNVLDLFQIAPTLLGDEEFGLKFIEENTEKVIANDAFTRLSKDRLLVLLKSDKLSCAEIDIFKAVQKWAEAQKKAGGEESKADIDAVMKQVRFPTMEVAHIASAVASSGLLEQAQLVQLFSYCANPDEKWRATQVMPFPVKPREGTGWQWDDKKKGTNVALSNKNLTAQMNGSSWNSALVMGNKQFNNGTHYWEVKIEYGGSDMIGVCSPSVNPTGSNCYSNQSSLIWFAQYSGSCYGNYQSSISLSATTGQTVGLLLQYDEGSKFFSLTFYRDGYRVGTPFTRIPAPVVAAVEFYTSADRCTLNTKAKKPAT
jgi:hypothetical protein